MLYSDSTEEEIEAAIEASEFATRDKRRIDELERKFDIMAGVMERSLSLYGILSAKVERLEAAKKREKVKK